MIAITFALPAESSAFLSHLRNKSRAGRNCPQIGRGRGRHGNGIHCTHVRCAWDSTALVTRHCRYAAPIIPCSCAHSVRHRQTKNRSPEVGDTFSFAPESHSTPRAVLQE